VAALGGGICQRPPAIMVELLQCQQKPPFWPKTKWWLHRTPPLLA